MGHFYCIGSAGQEHVDFTASCRRTSKLCHQRATLDTTDDHHKGYTIFFKPYQDFLTIWMSELYIQKLTKHSLYSLQNTFMMFWKLYETIVKTHLKNILLQSLATLPKKYTVSILKMKSCKYFQSSLIFEESSVFKYLNFLVSFVESFVDFLDFRSLL